jgi:hypothetical protein
MPCFADPSALFGGRFSVSWLNPTAPRKRKLARLDCWIAAIDQRSYSDDVIGECVIKTFFVAPANSNSALRSFREFRFSFIADHRMRRREFVTRAT